LGIAREHFDHVVVQAVVELPLECPRELRVLDFTRLQQKSVGVDLNALGLEANFYFDTVFRWARIEEEEGVFVAIEFATYFLEEIVHGNRRATLRPGLARSL
jgi:hypothetical protein